MGFCLGIDTSNYTTSAAVVDLETKQYINSRRILEVKEGAVGLRQSDALFLHIKNLPEIVDNALIGINSIEAVGVSDKPRSAKDSYMPCFLGGVAVASGIASAKKVPLYKFSHQAGHIAAALFSSDRLDLLDKPFISFHVSGGTTEALLVKPDKDEFFDVKIIASSLDLKMGQAVDRVGNMLGLKFPAGKELDKLSLCGELPEKPKATLKGLDCSISGLENKAKKLIDSGVKSEDVALFTITYLCNTLDKMTDAIKQEYGNLPFVFAGGVMSNTIIRKVLTEKHGACFASTELSSDNAVGTAVMTYLTLNK